MASVIMALGVRWATWRPNDATTERKKRDAGGTSPAATKHMNSLASRGSCDVTVAGWHTVAPFSLNSVAAMRSTLAVPSRFMPGG